MIACIHCHWWFAKRTWMDTGAGPYPKSCNVSSPAFGWTETDWKECFLYMHAILIISLETVFGGWLSHNTGIFWVPKWLRKQGRSSIRKAKDRTSPSFGKGCWMVFWKKVNHVITQSGKNFFFYVWEHSFYCSEWHNKGGVCQCMERLMNLFLKFHPPSWSGWIFQLFFCC